MDCEKESLELALPSQEDEKPPKRRRKRKSCTRRCVVHCLIYLLVLLVFVAALVGGSAIAFNRYVSPQIGGLGFFDAARLMSGLYSGERNRSKILTDTAGEEDLNDFYDELYTHLFLDIRSESELKTEYAGFDADAKAEVLAKLNEDAEWKAKYDAAKADGKDAVVCEYYVQTHRYPITIATLLDTVSTDSLNLAELRETSQVAAAEDPEETAGEQSEQGETETIAKLFENLKLDFKNSPALAGFDYTQGADYPANAAAVTMQITGKEITAVLSEILTAVLNKMDMSALNDALNSMSGEGEGEPDQAKAPAINIADYIKIPQVMITSTYDATGLTPQQIDEAFDKNVCLSATVEIRIGALLSSAALQNAINKVFEQMVGKASLGKIVLSVVKGMLPKTLFITAGIYPNDASKDILVKINNYSEKDQANLIKIINAVSGDDFKLVDDARYQELRDKAQDTEEGVSLFAQVNAMAADLFGKLDEMGVPIHFVRVGEENSRTVGLQLAHIQMLLHFLDLDGEDGVTPHDFMTVLKCLFSQPAGGNIIDSNLDGLYTQLQTKYGIPTTYWGDKGLIGSLTGEGAANVINQFHLDQVTFGANDAMRVSVKDRELVALIKDMIGSVGNSGSSGTAAAGDAEDDNLIGKLGDAISFRMFEIKPVETNLYSITAALSLGVTDLLGSVLEGEEGIAKTLRDAIPDTLSLGLTMYVRTDDDVIVEYSPEGHSIRYLLNAFDADYTHKVLDTITKLMAKLGGGGNGVMDIDSLGTKINEGISSVFDTVKDALHTEMRLTNGGIVLPSLYEIIHGFGQNKVDSSNGTLTQEDLPSVEAIRQVLNAVYAYQPTATVTLDGTQADALLATLSGNYYLKETLKANELFAGSDLSKKFSGDFIDMQAMYADTRTIGQLSVPIGGTALADLVQASGKTEGIEVNGLVNSVSVVDSQYSSEGGNLYLLMKFRADMQGDSESTEVSTQQLLPDAIYLDAKVLLHSSDGTYTENNPRFGTSIVINNNQTATTDLLRLVKVLAGTTVDTASVADTVKTAMQSAFETVENNLNVSYTDQLVIADIFTYLTEGKLVTQEGNTHYDRSQYMVDVDISGTPDYYATHTRDTDANRTTATALMNRLRELGAADHVTGLADNMVVWQGGAPAATGALYNDNKVTMAAENDFYEQLQAYYFFKQPLNSSSFTEDNNIFANLSAATLGNFFNLTGATVAYAGSDAAVKAAVSSAGLYNYSGTQYNAILSDKAMGSLVNSQGAISVDSEYIAANGISVTSFKMDKEGDIVTIEITCRIVSKGNDLLPQVFYLTTRSQANWSDAQKNFTTQIALNRFAADDLDKFLNNTGFLGTFNIKNTLDTDKVKNSVSTALNDLFNKKLKDYVQSIGSFADNDERGKGYLSFYNVYHKIVDTMGINRAIYDSGNYNADSDMQQILVALHRANNLLYGVNPSMGSESVTMTKVTDRAFANAVKASLATAGKTAQSVQSIFFVGTSDTPIYNNWQSLIGTIGDTEFAFEGGKNYIVTTACFDTANVASQGVSLLPDTIYTSLIINGNTKDVMYSFVNDMTQHQTDMLLSVLTDETGKTNITQSVQDLLTYYSGYGTFQKSDNFADYVGCLVK